MLTLSTTALLSIVAFGSSSQGGGFCEPSLVDSFDISVGWVARPLAITGDLLLASDGNANLLVYTLAAPGSPEAPLLLDAFDLPGATVPFWIEADGNVALVGEFNSTYVVDLSNPSVPVATNLGLYNAYVSAVEGDIAVTRFSGSTLSIWDVSDPSSPGWITDIFGAITGVALHEGIVYRLGSGTLTAFDLSDPFDPVQLDEIDGLPVGGGNLSDLVVEGDRLYMISTDAGIRVVDISDPSNLQYLGAAPAYLAETMDVSGSVVSFVPNGSSELRSLDFSTPGPAVPTVASAPLASFGHWARERDGYVYVTHGNGNGTSISIFDMSQCPAAPIITSHPQSIVADDGGPAVQFEVSGALIMEYQWRFNGKAIADGGPYSGATTNTLTVQPVDATEGAYDVLVTNAQGAVTSQSAVLAVIGGGTETCAGDLTDDNVVDVFDLLKLIGAWGPCR